MKLFALASRSAKDNASRVIFRHVVSNLIRPNWITGPWVAGGSVRRYVCALPHSDFDVFFATQEQHQLFLDRIRREAKVISERNTATNTTFVVRIPDPHQHFVPSLLNDKQMEPATIEVTIQAIRHAFYASPEAVINTFDFTMCQWVTDGDELAVGEFTLWDTARKRLALHEVTLAVSTLRRVLKYSSQGFTACTGMLTDLLERVARNPEIINASIISMD